MAQDHRSRSLSKWTRPFRAGVVATLLIVMGGSIVPTQSGSATASSINGPILFARGRPYIETIWRMSPSGEGIHKISDRADGSLSCPRGSSDGRRLTFAAYPKRGAGGTEIYWTRLDGSDAHRLTDNEGDDFDPDWSPSGRRLVFSRLSGGAELFVVRRDGAGERQITDEGGYNYGASWSPGGGRLVYHSATFERPGRFDIFVVNLKSGSRRQLTDSTTRGFISASPEWSPDGKRIVYSRTNDGDGEIMLMKSDGSNKRKLTENEVLDGQPSWSPDGRYIVFVRKVDEKHQIFRMPADGDGVRRVSNGKREDYCPDWLRKPS